MCMMDGDSADVWNETEQRSAKDRTCDCCDQVIKKGEVYLKHRSLFDGHWTTEDMCLQCKEMRACFADDPHHMLSTPGSFPHVLWECVDHFDPKDKWVALLNKLRERSGKQPMTWRSDGAHAHYSQGGSWE